PTDKPRVTSSSSWTGAVQSFSVLLQLYPDTTWNPSWPAGTSWTGVPRDVRVLVVPPTPSEAPTSYPRQLVRTALCQWAPLKSRFTLAGTWSPVKWYTLTRVPAGMTTSFRSVHPDKLLTIRSLSFVDPCRSTASPSSVPARIGTVRGGRCPAAPVLPARPPSTASTRLHACPYMISLVTTWSSTACRGIVGGFCIRTCLPTRVSVGVC